MAVLEFGAQPQQITWWFTPPGAPVITRHPFGSLNWAQQRHGDQLVGELPDAARPWRNGSKPANACGGQVASTCQQQHDTYQIDAVTTGLPVNLTFTLGPQPVGTGWSGGVLLQFGPCYALNGIVTCEATSITDPQQFQFYFYVTDLAGTILGSDLVVIPADQLAPPFSFTLALPECNAHCPGGSGALTGVQLTQAPLGRRLRGLPLV